MEREIEIAAELYLWGLPLITMHRTRDRQCRHAGQGVLMHSRKLLKASDRNVVGPNNDTLYSSGWFDLRYGDLRLDIPAMDHPDRYWSVMLLDAFTHVTYISRRQYGIDGASVRLTYNPKVEHDQTVPAETIAIGTPTVWVLARTLVEGPDDLPAARAVQEQITVTAPPDHPSGPTSSLAERPDRVYAAGALFFDELRKALKSDPPAIWHPQLTPEQEDLLYGNADPEVLASGLALGHSRVKSMGFGADRFKNGWGTRSKGTQFGNNVVARAACAQFTLAGHHRVENSAYSAQQDSRGEPLDGRHLLALHFPSGEEPPAKAFWSLTVYGPDMFFYDHPLNRYSLGDRTPHLKRDRDGLRIIIGNQRPADTSNWLPAPAGPYMLALRIYEGRDDVVDAAWFPPPLKRL